ncbi:unnamed protein product [Sympodiomycopsis kandeliae]
MYAQTKTEGKATLDWQGGLFALRALARLLAECPTKSLAATHPAPAPLLFSLPSRTSSLSLRHPPSKQAQAKQRRFISSSVEYDRVHHIRHSGLQRIHTQFTEQEPIRKGSSRRRSPRTSGNRLIRSHLSSLYLIRLITHAFRRDPRETASTRLLLLYAAPQSTHPTICVVTL